MIRKNLLVLFPLLATAFAKDVATPPAIASTGPGNRTILAAIYPPSEVVTVTADHADWTYQLGEPVKFMIKVAADPYPAEGISVKYRTGLEMLDAELKAAVVPADGLTVDGGTLKEPGFLRCSVMADVNGKAVKGLATAGFAPNAIKPTQTEPADFDAYWDAQKAELAKVPAEPVLTPLPERSTPKVEVFHWSLQNVGGWKGPSRMFGILAVPRGDGPFPAVLAVPGAGVRPYGGQIGLAEKGVITLEIGIHGIPVNLDPDVYQQLARGALAEYNGYNLDDRTRYYYHRVYLGCLRSNDYLAAHPKWDKKNLLVMGGSQGGQLSIVTAALDSRVTALAANYPAYCDVTGYLHGRAGGWPGFFKPNKDGVQTIPESDMRLVTIRYYDALNFARRLKIPGFYSWGYNDETCPPTSTFAAYNTITAPKELLVALQQGHSTVPAQNERINAWVVERLGVK
ncbi:MAG: hypothetical protein RLZZ214_4160 [Verrucomicrobiota bacterium]